MGGMGGCVSVCVYRKFLVSVCVMCEYVRERERGCAFVCVFVYVCEGGVYATL
jgi:hypothetical protein